MHNFKKVKLEFIDIREKEKISLFFETKNSKEELDVCFIKEEKDISISIKNIDACSLNAILKTNNIETKNIKIRKEKFEFKNDELKTINYCDDITLNEYIDFLEKCDEDVNIFYLFITNSGWTNDEIYEEFYFLLRRNKDDNIDNGLPKYRILIINHKNFDDGCGNEEFGYLRIYQNGHNGSFYLFEEIENKQEMVIPMYRQDFAKKLLFNLCQIKNIEDAKKTYRNIKKRKEERKKNRICGKNLD